MPITSTPARRASGIGALAIGAIVGYVIAGAEGRARPEVPAEPELLRAS